VACAFQILGDHEEGGRRQGGGHGLAHVDVAGDDGAAGGRDDGGVVEVDLGLGQRRAGLRLRSQRRLHAGRGRVGDEMDAVQQQHVLVVAPRRGPKPRDECVLTAGDGGHAPAAEG